MPKAYAVATYRSISDPEKLAAYAKLALPPSPVFALDHLSGAIVAPEIVRRFRS